jgi:hypothetical protein
MRFGSMARQKSTAKSTGESPYDDWRYGQITVTAPSPQIGQRVLHLFHNLRSICDK